MADTKISAAADIVSLTATDMAPVARSGSSTAYHATMAEIATWANTNLPVASTTVAGVVKVDGSTISISSGTVSGAAASPALPAMDGGSGSVGVATGFSRGDHVHPTDTTRAPLASPTFTGTPSLPTGTIGVTQTTGNNSTALATTAFVQAQMVASGAGVSTFNTRAGAVVLQQSDLTALGEYNDTGRNLVHNGAFVVAQRGAGPFTTSGYYSLDRWMTNSNTDTMSFSQVALTDADRAAIGDEAAIYALQNVFTGSATATAFNEITQRIEEMRRISNKTITLSFWAKAASGAPKIGINMTQSFGTGGSPSAAVGVLATGASVTLSTTWARYSTTIAIPSVAGKTFGTNNDQFINIRLAYSSAANNNAFFGNIGVQSGTIQLWGVQLEIGSMATPLARRDPADELALCQRFYQTGVAYLNSGYSSAGWTSGWEQPFPVVMRATPTMAISGTPTYGNASGAQMTNPWQGGYVMAAVATAAGGFSAIWNWTASADL